MTGGLVVDASALVAIVLGETGAEELGQHLEDAGARRMAAPTVVEAGIVLSARAGPDGRLRVERSLRDTEIDVVAFDVALAGRSLDAWGRYGKGRHPAALNFGDCLVYALADQLGWPVLCVGDDFAQTDLEVLQPGR